MTEEGTESGTWKSPYCCEFPARWDRTVTVAIKNPRAKWGSDVPKDMLMIAVKAKNGLEVQAQISKDEARAFVEAVNRLGKKMGGWDDEQPTASEVPERNGSA